MGAAAAAAILSAASRRLIGTLRFSWNRSASQWRPANRPSRDWPTTNRNAPSPTDRPAAIAVRERERQGEAGRGGEREGERGRERERQGPLTLPVMAHRP